MKRALLILGVIALIVLAFFAGRLLPRGEFMRIGAGGGPEINGEIDRPFMVEGGPGERASGEVVALDSTSVTIQTEDGEMIFQIDANTRITNFGTLAGLQIGDSVEIAYETSDTGMLALSITITNYLPNKE